MWILLRTWKGGGGLQGDLSSRELLWSLNWSRCQVRRPWGQTAWLHILPSPLWVVWFGAGSLISLNLSVPPGKQAWSNAEICLDTENPYRIHELMQIPLMAEWQRWAPDVVSTCVAGCCCRSLGCTVLGGSTLGPTPEHRPREDHNSEARAVHSSVCCSTVDNSQGMEKPKCPSAEEQIQKMWCVHCVCVCVCVYIYVCMYIHTHTMEY